MTTEDIKFAEARNKIQNKTIVDIKGKAEKDGSILIESLELEDGTMLTFQGSDQIGVYQVWMNVE